MTRDIEGREIIIVVSSSRLKVGVRWGHTIDRKVAGRVPWVSLKGLVVKVGQTYVLLKGVWSLCSYWGYH